MKSGFTIVEVVMVLVILAILAATAVPSFINVHSDARQAATQGIASALESAASANYAARTANKANGVAVKNCAGVVKTLQGGLDADYKIIEPKSANPDGSLTCTVAHLYGETAHFVGIPIP